MEVSCKFEKPVGCGVSICFVNDKICCSPGSEIKKFKGKHLSGQSDLDVEHLTFTGTISNIPKGILKIFPKLSTLKCNEAHLPTIHNMDLQEFVNLKSLTIGAHFESLPNDLFKGFSQLEAVSIISDRLKFVSTKILQPIMSTVKFICFGNSSTKAVSFLVTQPQNDYCLFHISVIPTANRYKKSDNFDDFKQSISENFLESENGHKFKDLWTNNKFSDFTITAMKGASIKEFKVHKIVLSVASPVFDRMLTSDFKECQESSMKIENFSAEAVECLLKWIYTGDLDSTESSKVIAEVFELAVMYDIQDLKSKSEMTMAKKINDENALKIIGIGNIHDSKILKETSFKIIKKSYIPRNGRRDE